MSDYRNKEVSDKENTVEKDEDVTPTNSGNEIEENDEQQFYPKKVVVKNEIKSKTGQKRTLKFFKYLNNSSQNAKKNRQ